MEKSFFGNVMVEAPEFQLPEAGENIFRLIRFEESDSFTQYSGEPKPEQKGWDIPTPQLVITCVVAEKGKSGGITHRFNGQGFVKFDELSKEQKEDEAYSNIEGYACCMHSYDETLKMYVPDLENGTLLARIVDERRTRDCKNILSRFCAAADLKKDENLFDELTRIAGDKEATFIANVVIEDYNGRDQYSLDGFKKVPHGTDSATVAADEELAENTLEE